MKLKYAVETLLYANVIRGSVFTAGGECFIKTEGNKSVDLDTGQLVGFLPETRVELVPAGTQFVVNED